MRQLILTLTLLAFTAPLYSQAKPPAPAPAGQKLPTPPPAAQIPGPPGHAIDKAAAVELVKQLETIAEAWVAGDANLPVGHLLDGVAFNVESAPVAKDVFTNKNYKGLTQLFMIAKIMVPLCRSDAETVQAVLPTIAPIVSKMDKYQEFRVYTAAELKSMDLPDKVDPNKAYENLKRLAEWEESRRGKLDTDLKVAKNNQMLYEIARNYARLLMLANKPGEDDKLVALVVKQEADKHSLFIETLGMIAADASNMEKDRAARMFRALEKVARPMTYARGDYLHPGASSLSSVVNSTLTARVPDFPGVRILTTMNALAPKAGVAAVEVPNGEDIDAVPQLAKAKEQAAKPTVKDQQDACKALAEILQKYRTATCLAEAKDVLARTRLSIAKMLITSKKDDELKTCKDCLLAIKKDSPGSPYEAEVNKLIEQLNVILDARPKKAP